MSISSTHKRARRGMRFRFCGCGGAQQEEHEALCVPVADAVAHPRAVVVHAQHAHAAFLAVMRAGRPRAIALVAKRSGLRTIYQLRIAARILQPQVVHCSRLPGQRHTPRSSAPRDPVAPRHHEHAANEGSDVQCAGGGDGLGWRVDVSEEGDN